MRIKGYKVRKSKLKNPLEGWNWGSKYLAQLKRFSAHTLRDLSYKVPSADTMLGLRKPMSRKRSVKWIFRFFFPYLSKIEFYIGEERRKHLGKDSVHQWFWLCQRSKNLESITVYLDEPEYRAGQDLAKIFLSKQEESAIFYCLKSLRKLRAFESYGLLPYLGRNKFERRAQALALTERLISKNTVEKVEHRIGRKQNGFLSLDFTEAEFLTIETVLEAIKRGGGRQLLEGAMRPSCSLKEISLEFMHSHKDLWQCLPQYCPNIAFIDVQIRQGEGAETVKTVCDIVQVYPKRLYFKAFFLIAEDLINKKINKEEIF